MDYYIGMLAVFGFDWAPNDFQTCQSQLLPLQQYVALYSLLGTQYGGDGHTNFGLPDLRGRMVLGQGTAQATGTQYAVAGFGGKSSVTLNVNQLPAHTHTATIQGSTAPSTTDTPASQAFLAKTAMGLNPVKAYAVAPAPNTLVNMGSAVTSSAGGGAAVDTMSPYLVLNPCMCINGTYPMRP